MTSKALGTDALDKCPHCGTLLATGLSSIDKPLEQCASCGGVVLRRGASEWDLLKGGQKLGQVASQAFIALAIGLAPPLMYIAAELGSGRRWQIRYALLLLAGGWVLAGGWQCARLTARIRRSRRRMADPMYLAKLVQHEMATIPRR